jgi:hypothetical protein
VRIGSDPAGFAAQAAPALGLPRELTEDEARRAVLWPIIMYLAIPRYYSQANVLSGIERRLVRAGAGEPLDGPADWQRTMFWQDSQDGWAYCEQIYGAR